MILHFNLVCTDETEDLNSFSFRYHLNHDFAQSKPIMPALGEDNETEDLNSICFVLKIGT